MGAGNVLPAGVGLHGGRGTLSVQSHQAGQSNSVPRSVSLFLLFMVVGLEAILNSKIDKNHKNAIKDVAINRPRKGHSLSTKPELKQKAGRRSLCPLQLDRACRETSFLLFCASLGMTLVVR